MGSWKFPVFSKATTHRYLVFGDAATRNDCHDKVAFDFGHP